MSATLPHAASTDPEVVPGACVTCGAQLTGPFCAQCGEAAPEPDQGRLRPFLRDAASGALDLDSRLWRTFVTLFAHPGRLTAEYVRGSRKPYLGPLQVFLLANVVLFAALELIGGFSTFTTELRYHISQPLYGPWARELVTREGAWGSASAMLYEQRFDKATPRFSNSLVILIVPLYALVLKAVVPRRYFMHHVVFALHFVAWMLLMITLIPFAMTGVVQLASFADRLSGGGAVAAWLDAFLNRSEVPVSLLLLAIFSGYLIRACRVAYGGGRVAAVLRTLAVLAMTMPVLLVYRMILFFTVYLTL